MEGDGGKDPVLVSYKQGSYMFYSMRHRELLWQLESVQMGWLCLMKWGPLQSIHEANPRTNEFRYLVINFLFFLVSSLETPSHYVTLDDLELAMQII